MMTQDEDVSDNALHEAVRLGDVNAAKEALKIGFHPDTIGLFEWNALHEASHNGDTDIVELLLKYGACPNKRDILNANTALHYASSENHSHCLEVLLEKGGDPTMPNKRGLTCIDLTRSESCKEVLKRHGYSCKTETTIKSILKSSKKSDEITNSKSTSTHLVTTSPVKSKHLKVAIDCSPYSNEEDRASPPLSIDSGTFSPTVNSSTSSRDAWEEMKGNLLQIPSSPARSQGSSFGSLTSLGSSSCSAADDCAGQFVLSFQYNSKKQEFKLRLWEIVLTSLLPPSKMPKDTSMHLYVKSTILLDEDFQSNPLLRRKSEIFRLQAGQTSLPLQQNQCATNLLWNDKQAWIEFKNSLSLDYAGISKQMVATSTIKVCLCIRPRRSFISNKSKSNTADPVLASTELRMGEAVKKIMKEAYDTERHDVLGVTRQAIPLDGVISERHSYDNHSYNSDPSVHVRMTSLLSDNHAMTRSSSVGNLKEIKHRPPLNYQSNRESKVDLDGGEELENDMNTFATNSVSSLDSVLSHTSIPNPEVKIRLPRKKSSNKLNAVVVEQTKGESHTQKGDVKVTVPRHENAVYNEFKKKQAGNKARGSIAQKARTKLKSSSKVMVATANSVLKPSVTAVTAFDEEERTVGSPSEDDTGRGPLTFEERLKGHSRSGSSGSLVRVDESPPPFRRHRRPAAVPTHPARQPSKPQTSERNRPPTSSHWAMNIDPEGTKIEIEDFEKTGFVTQVSKSSRRNADRSKSDIEMNTFTSKPQAASHRLQSTRLDSREKLPKSRASKKLLYDESDFTETSSANNPCFIAD